MLSPPTQDRTNRDLTIALVFVATTVIVSMIGIRIWAYNAWVEYGLVCYWGDSKLYTITAPLTPTLRKTVYDHYMYFGMKRNSPHFPIIRREGEKLFMQAWYLIYYLEFMTKDTGEILARMPGAYGADVSSSCYDIYDNPDLVTRTPGDDPPVLYIVSSTFHDVLSVIVRP